jgi:uncharacterized protein with von Willebrand factor type A (vWA) domain
MKPSDTFDLDARTFIYFPSHRTEDTQKSQQQYSYDLPRDILDKLLNVIAREVLREKTPTMEELEQTLQGVLPISGVEQNYDKQEHGNRQSTNGNTTGLHVAGKPTIAYLIQKGYLKDSTKWLSSKGFLEVGGRILGDVMMALKKGDTGLHSTTDLGSGSIIMDTTKKYEPGNDIRLINVPSSLLNAVQRAAKNKDQIKIPLAINIEDLEEYETMRDVRVAVVYCIDLSSTMRYSSMFGDMSRIEAAKRALWSLFLLNRKYFPSDSIYIVGFGALASKVAAQDIPYLKTFEPGSDFLHYTNYQSAFRLARKILQKDGAVNRRIVLITDGHPSACFIDDNNEHDKILSQRPYAHFYTAGDETLKTVREEQDMTLDTNSGEVVYLCYRYRQVDEYIGEKTIQEARKCRRMGFEIDTIMISEEDSLLQYVNDMEKRVRGRSYYINPNIIDKVLVTDYLNNRKQTIRAHS